MVLLNPGTFVVVRLSLVACDSPIVGSERVCLCHHQRRSRCARELRVSNAPAIQYPLAQHATIQR
jgi:hypothetical protein